MQKYIIYIVRLLFWVDYLLV